MLEIIASASRQWSSGTEPFGVTSVSVALLLCTSLLLVMRKSIPWTQPPDERRMKKGRHSIPGPRGLPIFGNIFQLGDKIHETFMNMAKVYGDVFQIHIASRKVVVLNGAKAINQALVRQTIDFAGRPDLPSMHVMDKVTGRGLTFSTYNEQWRLHRKISETALRHFTSGRRVETLQKKVMFEVESLINFMTNNNSEVDFVVSPERSLQLSLGNVIGSFLFGKRHELDDPKLLGLLNLQRAFSDVFSSANMVDFMPWLLKFAPKVLNKWHEYLSKFKALFADTIKEHLEKHKQGADDDIMNYMLTLREKIHEVSNKVQLTPETVLSSTYDFFGAGSDSVPATLMWLISYMVTHPEIQDEVHKELDSVLSDGARTPCLDDHCRLPFTNAVIAEAQRHSSVVALSVPHSTTRDTVLEGGYNLHIPKDTIVFVNLYSVHYDNVVFPKPEKFLPERFLNADGSFNKEMTTKLVVFGAGRRRCLGSEIARVELFIYFATLMQRFRFSCPEGETVSLEGSSGLVSKPALKTVRIKSRSHTPQT